MMYGLRPNRRVAMLAVGLLLAASHPAKAQDEPVLSPVRIERLAKLIAEHSHDAAIDSSVTTSLGLTRPGEVLTLRQLSLRLAPVVRLYHRLPDGGWLFVMISPESARAYRANPRQELVAAVEKRTGEPPVVIPASDAERWFKAEISYWADVADHFDP
jgi:hypothetical protein